MNIKNEILVRIYAVLGMFVLVALVIFVQAIRISSFPKEKQKWLDKAESYHNKMVTIKAERGNILAQDGSLLATSLPYYDLHFDPLTSSITEDVFYDNVDSLAWCISNLLDPTYTEGGMRERLINARNSGDRYLSIKRNASHIDLERAMKFPIFNKGRFKGGLIIEKRPRRQRPFGILAHRTIGYVREGAKPVGLEGKFNKILGGEAGERLMRKIKGKGGENLWIPVDDYTEIKPISGQDIKTTIDINLQDITEQALIRGLQRHDAELGTAIVMEVETGAIKAIANVGKTQDGWWEKFNYAVGRKIEPGSTFKLATIMALMEDKIIDLDDTIQMYQGKYTFYEDEMLDASAHGLKEGTFRKAFEISSNVALAKLVNDNYKSDKKKYINHLRNFNLDLPTGIEIDGETAPFIKDPDNEEDNFSGTTLPWMSIGYELEITPLQLLTFYNAVANDGKMMKPYLVKEILKHGEIVEQIKPTIIDRSIASPRTIKNAKELLEGVVENGTAKKLKSEVYRFAGKTGTAQVDYSRERKAKKYQASFAGYFPAKNPKYSIMVMIYDPKENGFYGGQVAGPVFREIADKAYSSKIELQPPLNQGDKPGWRTYQLPDLDVGDKEELSFLLEKLRIPHSSKTDEKWCILRAKSDTLSLQTRQINTETVPNVKGMGLRDAIYILENKGLKVTVSGLGKVQKQSVPVGRKIIGQTVHLTLS